MAPSLGAPLVPGEPHPLGVFLVHRVLWVSVVSMVDRFRAWVYLQ